MARLLKQSTAFTFRIGPFVDSTDGVTAETGLTITQSDIRLSKNGGAFAQKNAAGTLVHDENGWYALPFDTTDTGTLGPLTVAIAESGALPVWEHFLVVPANVYDSLVAGSDYLETDVTQLSADTTAANNAESFFDGTGYAGTGNTIPTVTAVTQQRVGYQDGAVWIDTVNGTAGTTSYVNGTADKPVSNLANALTIATAVGLKSLRLSADSSITLTASVAGWTIIGGTVALGGQTTTGARFEDCILSGTMSGAATFVRCTLNAITGLIGTCLHCGLANNSTLAAGNSFFAWCYASRVSAGIPTYTFSAGSSSVVFRGYAGGLTVASLTSDHELRYDAVSGGLTLAASCTGGTLVIRGLVRLTDNSGGAVTITQGYGTTVSTDSSGRAYADVQLIEAADATDQIRDAVVDDATRIDASALNALSAQVEEIRRAVAEGFVTDTGDGTIKVYDGHDPETANLVWILTKTTVGDQDTYVRTDAP